MIDQVPRVQFVATSGQTIFAYNFQIFVKTDITVEQNGVILTVDVDFTVSGVGTTVGGNVTLTVGATVNDIMTIYRSQNFDRETDYQELGDFLSGTVNDDFNRMILMDQQVRESISRSLQYAVDDIVGTIKLPVLSDRISKFLGFDSSGNPVAVTGDPNVILDFYLRRTTVAIMVADTTLAVGDFIITAGYTSAGDGGDNYYEVVAAGTGTDDGGSFIDLDTHQAKALFPGGDIFPEQFGALRDGSTDDSTAINTCWAFASNQNRSTKLQAGFYKVDSTLYATPVGSTFQTCQITGAGMGFIDSAISEVTVIDGSSLVADPVIILQLGRGTYMGKFQVVGSNGDYSAINVEDFEYVNTDYVKAGVQDAQFAPQCAIAIDGGIGAAPGTPWANVTYRNLASGSANGIFEEILVRECVLGIGHTIDPSPAVQGNMFVFRDCYFNDCKVGFACGQTQARVLHLLNCSFNRFRTAIDMQEFGQQVGNNPLVTSSEFVNGFEVVSSSLTTNQLMMIGCRSEQVHRVGQHGIGAAIFNYPALFYACDFQLLNNSTGPRSPIVYDSNAAVTFKGGGFKDIGSPQSAIAPYNFQGLPVIFEGGTKIEVPDIDFFVVDGPRDLEAPMEHENTLIHDASASFVLGPTGNKGALPTTRIRGVAGTLGARRGAAFSYVPNDFDRYRNMATTSNFVFSATELAFDSTDVTFLLVGDFLFWRMDPIGKSSSSKLIVALKVTAISAPAVTCELLFKRFYYDETVTPTTVEIYIQQWAPGAALTGDTNTSTSITNVSPTTIIQDGDWLDDADGDLVTNTRVVSGGGTATLTLNKAATATSVGDVLFWDRIHTVDTTALF